MKALVSKNLISAVLVVVALVAGTALLAGYVDGPQGAPAGDSKCADCPMAGTPDCCKIAGSCQHHAAESTATSACEKTCGDSTSSGCSEKKAETNSCASTGCGGQMQGACGAGGCCPAK